MKNLEGSMDGSNFICITGPDGSGKSTAIEGVCQRLTEEKKLRVAKVSIWDMLLDPATRGKVGFKSKAELDQFFTILHPVARSLFLFHCIYQALHMASQKSVDLYLIDSYWYKYYATEIAHGADQAALESITAIFPQPRLTFYLDVDTGETSRRKETVSGYESGFSSGAKGSFVEFQKIAAASLEALRQRYGWITIPGAKSPVEVQEEIVSRISEVF